MVAYGALVPQAALDVPAHGWVNLHFSLLPAWRGAAPVQHAIMAGDELTGAATFRLEAGLDTGPVFGIVTEPIGPRDTAGDLLGRLAVSGAGLLVATLDGIEAGTLVAEPQPADGISLAPRIETADARVDWSLPAHVVDRRVRGVTPAPGAWTTWRGDRLRLGPVEPARRRRPRRPVSSSVGARRRARRHRPRRRPARRGPAGRQADAARPPTGRAAPGPAPASGWAHDPAPAGPPAARGRASAGTRPPAVRSSTAPG